MNPLEILQSHDLRSLRIRQDNHPYAPDNVSSARLRSFTWEYFIILIFFIIISLVSIYLVVSHNYCTFLFRLIPQRMSEHTHTSDEVKTLNDTFIELTPNAPISFASDLYPKVPEPIPLPRT